MKNIIPYSPLFKRDTNGGIRVWQMQAGFDDENTAGHQVISGVLNGKMVTSEWKLCKPKNVGKVNGTTALSQAEAEVAALYTKKTETGYFYDIGEIDGFEKTKPMLAHDYSDYPTNFSTDTYSQPKLDGCVSGSLFVETENGIKTVNDVFLGNDEYILSYNHELQKKEFSKILGKFKNEKHIKNNSDSWLLIKTKSGRVIKVTDNHRIFLPEIGSYREAKYLNIGDFLLKSSQN